MASPSSPAPLTTSAAVVAAAQPSITGTTPANGATNVPLDGSISCNLSLPNAGLDPSTVNSNNVQIYQTVSHAMVSATVTTSAAGDSLLLQPNALLAPNTQYTFTVSSGVKDASGASMVPFTMSFTSGTGATTADPTLQFQQVGLPSATGAQFTDVKVGPDHRLYASTEDGRIFRWSINADGTLGSPEIITSLRTAEAGQRLITGFDFDPRSPASSPTLWVSNGWYGVLNAPDWTGKITVMSGPDLQTVQDAVINLPRSFRDHLTEQPAFGPDGALYFGQASDSSYGAPDDIWGNRPEHMLSAAILRLDVTMITPGQPLNAMTIDAGGSYNPFALGAPLTIYASGVRNAFDLVWTHDGELFAPNNGSSPPGNAPGSPDGTVPAINGVTTYEEDYLYKIVPGGYYGHPNPTIGHYVLDGGNPASGGGSDLIAQYPLGTTPDPAYQGYVFDFGPHPSPNGIIEYQDHTFDGKLQDALLVTEYGQGNDIVALTRNANGTITGQRGITGFDFLQNPLSLCEDPANGNIYVSEVGAEKLTLLRPIPPHAAVSASQPLLVYNAADTQHGGGPTAPQTLTITNTGNIPLTISGVNIVGDPTALDATPDAAAFTITNASSIPASLAPGASFNLNITFTASSSIIHAALLQIQSNAPMLSVQLHGIGTPGQFGTNEPSLVRVLRAYNIPTIVGAGPNDINEANPTYPEVPDPSSQEVPMQRLEKAGSGPVTITPLASFDAPTQPVLRLGYYTSGSPNDTTELFYLNQSDAQTVNPTPQGATSFDPGYAPFSLYGVFPGVTTSNGQPDIHYSEDVFNKLDPTFPHKFRLFPLENPDKSVVPNAYVVAAEDYNNPQYNSFVNFVGIIRNVKPAPDAVGFPVLGLENLDGAPFSDRLIFNRIQVPNTKVADIVHDNATERILNSGDKPLVIYSLTSSNPQFFFEDNIARFPVTIAPGGSLDVHVRFIANQPPPNEPYNETNDTQTVNGIPVLQAGGVWNATLTISSNDPINPNKVIQLAGYFQVQTENENEPGLQTIINLMAGYQTVISNDQRPNYIEPANAAVYYGEEVVSAYWQQADPTIPINVIQLDSYHNQFDLNGNPTTPHFGYIAPGNPFATWLIANDPYNGQTLFPHANNGGAATASVNIPGTFGWDLDGNYSDDTMNTIGGGAGHHVRFYPLRDRSGNVIPNEFIAALDYGSTTFENYDFQDNVYLISNIHPVNRAPSPTDTQATANDAGVLVQWARPMNDPSLVGYNIYRGTSATGLYVKLNTSPTTGTSYIDPGAAAGQTAWYKVTAVDAAGESVGATASILAPPPAPANVTTTVLSASQVQLNWAPVTGGWSYRIEREPLGGGNFVEVAANIVGGQYIDNGLLGGTTYIYRIRAENGSGLSPYSNLAQASTPVPIAPSAPTALTVTSVAPNAVGLNWSPSTGTVSGYHVERFDASTNAWPEIAANVSGTSYTDRTVIAGRGYLYRVRAENAGAFSAYSNTVAVNMKPGGMTQTAVLLGTFTGSRWNQSGALDPTNNEFWYAFDLGGQAKITINLRGLKDRITVELTDADGNVIKAFDSRRRRSGSIAATLSAGRYYLRFDLAGTKGTPYAFTLTGKLIKVRRAPTRHQP